ncbi:MAG: carboxymuconolactone decarboxylase family protein [Candidatus Hydrogenedentes bacterium]|nr:carboxymuconolactone decarboxylase family protein [Candidatus Hydrogenedentota bacterium]
MSDRISYHKIAPNSATALLAQKKYIDSCSIDPKLRYLVELRVSQINGCVYCCDKHSQEARSVGETQQRLDCLPAWRDCAFFDEREKAALDWAESLTYISKTGAPDETYNALHNHFSEIEIVDLTHIIAMMNLWNRLAVAFRMPVAPRKVKND